MEDKKIINNGIKAKPFVKWAGGKGALIDEITKFYPKELGNEIFKYCEPFVGGGAILFDILSKFDIKEVYISDLNEELISLYKVIRDDVHSLIKYLEKFEEEYLPLSTESRKEYYYKKREEYNNYILKKINDTTYGSALFLFINRTCFNGLYRVNSQGLYNVPMGAYKNPKICDKENLIDASLLLKDVKIYCGSYLECINFVDENTFVYFDPPYRPLSESSSFTSYAKEEFGDMEQIKLCEFFKKLDKKGGKLLLSNSDPKNVDENDEFFDKLYNGFSIKRIASKRRINSKADKRGEITELLVSNMGGEKIMKRDFNEWLESFRKSIATYEYYVDFEKIHNNVEKIKVELNILNSLIGSKNIKHDFINLLNNYPEILKCIPILLAVRSTEIYVLDTEEEFNYSFKKSNYTPEQYAVFMEKTGLFDLIQNKIINNLYDYVTGVETGLDSNGRKNRGGHLMEDIIEKFIQKAGFKKDENYFKEMYTQEIQDKWNINLSPISNQGKTQKRFDYVVKTSKTIYLIETNFYASNGSKLNETARSYKTIALEVKEIPGVEFVWFTDGKGWKSAKGNFQETFDVMEHIYNITDLKNGVMRKIFV
ncbi:MULTISPECIES: DpnII family type II restriction endonuclease [unclassified Fusobacterium]|uniref:DpnII family type II restriction endonuclease n=1 Tax=unclassified Fusobacterium TaxID=2648384 RepID=UPI00201284E6|nr:MULTISPECIES: DpnII family type II restriction endonuclease [unclassified Fusobacterium]MBR8702231.1 hypothetical protein [Fusobacterium sp. DD45]MBR8712044.1 hypothetical protein [Fusobacterium sp. DD28]MBR8752627.1 hypothetical protein [Fusobacterium sp. DD26]